MFILMVTWFYYEQPPATSQTTFTSAKECGVAREAVLADQKRLQAQRDSIPLVQTLPNGGTVTNNPLPAPTVSAVCVAQ